MIRMRETNWIRVGSFVFCGGWAVLLCLAVVGCGTQGRSGSGSIVAGRDDRQDNVASLSIAAPEGLPAAHTIRLHHHDRMLFVSTAANGRDVGLFLLDTGSELNVIEQGLAARLRLESVGRGTALGIGGPEPFVYRGVERVVIGDLRLNETRLAALSLNRFRKPIGPSMTGVLGFSALRSVPFTIDAPKGILTVYRPGTFDPPADGRGEPLYLSGGLPVVVAEVARHPVLLLLDTGAENELTLSQSVLARWPDIVSVPLASYGRSVGVGGTVAGIRTWVSSLRLFGVDLKQVPVSFDPSPIASGQLAMGRVGIRLLQYFRLTFNVPQRRVWAEFRPLGPGA